MRSGARRKPAVLLLVTALLLGAAALHLVALNAAMLALLVMAMGALNNTFQREGEVSIGLTYMTGALVKLGQAIAAGLQGEQRGRGGGYLMLWGGLAGGAVMGAFAYSHLAAAALWLAAAWAAVMTFASVRIHA